MAVRRELSDKPQETSLRRFERRSEQFVSGKNAVATNRTVITSPVPLPVPIPYVLTWAEHLIICIPVPTVSQILGFEKIKLPVHDL